MVSVKRLLAGYQRQRRLLLLTIVNEDGEVLCNVELMAELSFEGVRRELLVKPDAAAADFHVVA